MFISIWGCILDRFLILMFVSIWGCILDFVVDTLLVVKTSPICYKKSMRKLASKKVASEDARVPNTIPGWGQEGGKGGGKPPPGGGKPPLGGRRFGRKEEKGNEVGSTTS